MYSDIKTIAFRYWKAYGGMKALIRSPYLHMSVLMLIITCHFWAFSEWWEQPLSIVPNLLGFSLGGLAMLLSFGNEEFQKSISEIDVSSGSKPTAFMEVSATFVHFMLLQLATLFVALTFKSLYFYYPWSDTFRPWVNGITILISGFGYLLFLYSIASMIAAVFAVFRMTSWFEIFQNPSNDAQ